MKKLVSLIFGMCGILYGVPTQAANLECCAPNNQCGNVCCPTKGCNADKTGCATEECASGMLDEDGYCVPGPTCPSGFVGYDSETCCGDGYSYPNYASISYDGYSDYNWQPDAYGWTPPRNNFSVCGCPYSECGFYYDGNGYCTNDGYTFTHESVAEGLLMGPNTGCPYFSGYNPVYSGPGYENNRCCYMDVDGKPFEAGSIAFYTGNTSSCSNFDLFLEPNSSCCPEGYYNDGGICKYW